MRGSMPVTRCLTYRAANCNTVDTFDGKNIYVYIYIIYIYIYRFTTKIKQYRALIKSRKISQIYFFLREYGNESCNLIGS